MLLKIAEAAFCGSAATFVAKQFTMCSDVNDVIWVVFLFRQIMCG
jgi:hypothetical protein